MTTFNDKKNQESELLKQIIASKQQQIDDLGQLYWVQHLVDVGNEVMGHYGYFHYEPKTHEIKIHTHIAKNEDEFREFYRKVKSL